MKKITFLLSFFFLVAVYAQPKIIITAVVDGTCSQGTPKMVELYVSGTADFSQYKIQKQPNDNTNWDRGETLTDLGTVTDDYAYVYYDGSQDNFSTEFPSASRKPAMESQQVNINGDDRVRIISNDLNQTVMDVFGEEGTDGTGTAWEYTDSWAKRKPGQGPNTTFDVNEWDFGGKDALDRKCSTSDSTPLEDDMGGIQIYLSTPRLSIEGLSVYPNPVYNGRFKIISKENKLFEVQIFDLLGKRMLSDEIQANEWIDVSTLTEGIYILKITQGEQTSTQKLIIR